MVLESMPTFDLQPDEVTFTNSGVHTVDGSEIRRENQLRLVIYPIYLQGFVHPRWWLAGFLKHQQYERPMFFSYRFFNLG